MKDTLIIIPTKGRAEYMNCLIQNLILQSGDFDVYIADMNEDTKYMFDNYLFRASLERLKDSGHDYLVENVSGNSQLFGYNAGLNHAHKHGYKLCFGSDDDITYELGFIEKGIKHMNDDPNLGVLVGLTLNPRFTRYEQTLGKGMPDLTNDKEFQGTLEHAQYYHCVFVPKDLTPRYYEQVFGAFFFRTEDAVKVGWFPMFMSQMGFRGEMMVQTAISWTGKKVMLDPNMVSWHYQASYGGLRFSPDKRMELVNNDLKYWNAWLKLRQPRIFNPLEEKV